jgi:hypothetical protein
MLLTSLPRDNVDPRSLAMKFGPRISNAQGLLRRRIHLVCYDTDAHGGCH